MCAMNITRTLMNSLFLSGMTPCFLFGGALTFFSNPADDYRANRLVLTQSGTPWVVFKTPSDMPGYSLLRLRYWDGQAWKAPEPEINATGMTYSASFFGGSDRDAWLALMPDPQGSGQGTLLKLGEGRIEATDTFHKWSPARDSEIYVARDGRVFNWGESFLACRQTNGVWSRFEAALPLNHHAVPAVMHEHEGNVWFFASPMLYRVGPDGKMSEWRIPSLPAGDRNTYAHRWGNNRIVVWPGDHRKSTTAFDIGTLQAVVWPPQLKKLNVWGKSAFSTRDGTLWLSRSDGQAASTVLLRPDTLQPVEWTNVPFPNRRTRLEGGVAAIECTDGTVVSGTDALVMIGAEGKTRRIGWESGLSGPSSDLQEDRNKRLWFINGARVAVFDPTRPLEIEAAKAQWEEVDVNGDTWLFQPRPGEIACFAKNSPELMRWDGHMWQRQSLPFDPHGYTLHRVDDRGVIWVGRTSGSEWFGIDEHQVRRYPDEAAAKAAALADGATRFTGNCGATPENTNDVVVSGGSFHYPNRDNGYFEDEAEPVREFEGLRLRVSTVATPIANEYVMRMCEDKAKNLWFLVSPPHEIRTFKSPTGEIGVNSTRVRLFRYKPDAHHLEFAVAPPPVCGRTLEIPLKDGTPLPRQRVVLFSVEGLPWVRLSNHAPTLRFRFPTNGTYICRAISFDYGGKVPGETSFTVKAQMDLPETQYDGTMQPDLLLVTSSPWYPPIRALPALGGGPVRLAWRPEGEEDWHPVQPWQGINVAMLKRGRQTLLFRAEEEALWCDPSPLRVEALVTIPLEEYLLCLQNELWSNDLAVRRRARESFRDCVPEAKERLAELRMLAERHTRVEMGIHTLSPPRIDDVSRSVRPPSQSSRPLPPQ